MVNSNIVLSGISLLAVASARPATTKDNNLPPREWQECSTGTWYYTCGGISGCFDYDPCVAPSETFKTTREWHECPAGTWYSKRGAYDGCFDYDPCVAPQSDQLQAREWKECPVGTWYSKCGIYDGCFNYDPCVSPSSTASDSDTLTTREWQECSPGTWYSKCGQYDGCFDYDPCVEPSNTLTTREWQECSPGTWYSKCGIYDGCFDYDPCVEPSTASDSSDLETRQDCPTGTWYSTCGDISGCFDYDPCVAPSRTLKTRTECSPGTWYSKCGQYDGCFDHDPCVSIGSTVPAYNGTTGTNGTHGTNGTSGFTTDDQRDMFVVVPAEPETTGSAVSYFQVVSGAMDINQVGVFSGIPAEAKTCTLRWKQGEADERVFSVIGNGRVSVYQIEDIDATDGVSWSEVEDATVTSDEFGPDLTNWDSSSIGATDHGSWDLNCAETIYLSFATHKGSENVGVDDYRNVYFEQDENNGFYISYTQ